MSKKSLDQFDLEAEAEGAAIDAACLTRLPKLGKRTAKDRQREARGEGIQTYRMEKKHMAKEQK